MITLNEINKKLHFPVIDFKFQNAGNATALLWEFNIAIKCKIIDLSPSLEFTFEIRSSSLEVYAFNSGFGSAKNCTIKISGSYLSKVFSTELLNYNGDILSGERKRICVLSPSFLILENLKELTHSDDQYHTKNFNNRINGINISNIDATWNYTSETGAKSSGQSSINHTTKFFLTEMGFHVIPNGYIYSIMPPSEIYCVIIDMDKNDVSRKYPISRKINSGDVDRFHIMIGATKSAKIDLQFEFKIDSGSIVKSNLFSIEIWNPIGNSQYYKDGDIFQAKLENTNDAELDNFKYRFDRKHNKFSEYVNYPFLNEKNNRKSSDF